MAGVLHNHLHALAQSTLGHALGIHNGVHFNSNAGHLGEPGIVNLFGTVIGRGTRKQSVFINGFAVGQTPNPGIVISR